MTVKAKKPAAKPEIIHERLVSTGSSGWVYERIQARAGVKIRVIFRRDSYAEQSFARVEYWTGSAWTEVLIGEPPPCFSYPRLPIINEVYDVRRDANALEEKARKVAGT